MGIVDDWSYIRTAQVLSDTGHIAYNGWATALLGWQLYFGALLIKIFGFSFTVTRMGTLLIAVLMAALMQRLLVRMGATKWNAAAATLVYVISPVSMAVTFTFMSDVYGMFALVVCCYCCVRSLQAASDKTAAGWVCAAALSNAVGGTARQIAWIGVLVMVPCTLWLLRRRRLAVWLGGAATVLGVLSVPCFMHWFNQQPFAVPESIKPVTTNSLGFLLTHVLPRFEEISALELTFLALPLLLMFAPAIYRSRRGAITALVILCLLALRLHRLHMAHRIFSWEVPYFYNNFSYFGFEFFFSFIGLPPLLLTPRLRVVLTVLVLFGALAFLVSLFGRARSTGQDAPPDVTEETGLSLSTLGILLLPATAAYLILLLPRGLVDNILDRYFLFPEFTLLVFALRIYQRNIQQHLPAVVWIAIAVAAALDTAGLHDTFSLFRAQETLLQEPTSAGIPRTAIDGGAQYNGWTEVITTGHLNEPRIVNPPGSYHPLPIVKIGDPCRTVYLELSPSIRARYVVSFDPTTCNGPSQFKPVSFHTWYGPHTRVLYLVNGPEYGRQ